MMSSWTRLPTSSQCIVRVALQPCRSKSIWERKADKYYDPRAHNRAQVWDKNAPFTFKPYDPNGVYWRLYLKRSGPREFGKWQMDFSGYEKALENCKGGMVNVKTMPLRPGESIEKGREPRKFPSGNWHQRKMQDDEFAKWRWFLPKLLPVTVDRPPSFLSMNQPLVSTLPGQSLKWGTALQVWKKEGRKQLANNLRRGYFVASSRYNLWYYEGGFDKEKFLTDAVHTYIMAHQAARDREYERMKDTALEFACGELTKRFSHYRQLWRCWSVTEKPKVMGRYCVKTRDFTDSIIMQVFVRLKTREEHVAYSRIGERIAGEEGKQVDKDQIIILERSIEGNSPSFTRALRILEIIPAANFDTWKPKIGVIGDDDLLHTGGNNDSNDNKASSGSSPVPATA